MSFNIYDYKFTIKLLSGLHIGAQDTEMRIGGVDNKVIRNPIDNMPYIPGSSIKGKVRSLLEYRANIQKERTDDGKPFSDKDMHKSDEIATIVKLFGASGDGKEKSGVTRLSFADAFVSKKDKERKNSLFEVKAETAINRITGTADGRTLRFTERVIAGLEFDGLVTMKVFYDDKKEIFEKMLLDGLKLLIFDAIGGYGSRGYGRVEITFEDKELQEKFEKTHP